MRKTDICNIALGWVGANLIMDMAEDTIEAELCVTNYETSIKAALEAVDWTFARARAALVPLAEEIVGTDYSNHFQLPSNCLVVRWVSNSSNFKNEVKWEKEQHTLYASAEKLWVKYTGFIEDPNKYTAKFIHMTATQLAADICIPLNGDKIQEKELRGKFEMLTDQAGGADGVQSLPQKVKANTLTRARFGMGSGGRY